MSERIKVIAWYLLRPRYYSNLFLLIKNRLLRSLGARKETRGESTAWCIEHAVDTETAIARLTGRPMQGDVRGIFTQEFVEADRQAASCPVKMGGAANLNLIYWLCEHTGARRVIETGVAYGWSSLALLLSLAGREGARLISTDMPYPGRNNEEFVGCVVPVRLRGNWRILRSADRDSLPKALQEIDTLDLCHYDSDKSHEGRMWAYSQLWRALRSGGLLISDDIGDNLAFRDFARQTGVEPVVVAFQKKHAGVLVKP